MMTNDMYTFRANGGKPYTISKNALFLSGTFKDMVESSKESNIVLSDVIQKHENDPSIVYHLNTDRLLSYVHKYMKIWEGREANADYVSVAPVQTSELNHILTDINDIQFLEEFIQETLLLIRTRKLPGYPPIPEKLQRHEKRRLICTILGELACQCDELLNIQSLASKIYAYIAIKIWETSAADFAYAMQDPNFKNAMDKALEEWRQLNPDKFSMYANGQTTDGVSIAPAVDLDDDYSDSE